MIRHPKHAGFTLIEILLYIAICSTLLVSVSLFVGVATSARVKTNTITEVDQQGSIVLDKIAGAIRDAAAITAPSAGTDGDTLTLMPTGSSDQTTFGVNNGMLQIARGAESPGALTNNRVTVDSFNVTNLSQSSENTIIQISITLSHKNTSGRNEFAYSKTFTTSAEVRK